jgi:hypothetical protein
LYKGSAGEVSLIERGKEFKDFVVQSLGTDCDVNWWQDVATYDVDGDNEDEIITLFGASSITSSRDYRFGDIFIFKYADYKRVNNAAEFDCRNGRPSTEGLAPCWVNIDDIPADAGYWAAVTVGELELGEFAEGPEVVTVGEPGDLVKFTYNRNSPDIPVTSYLWNREWPDEPQWLDIESVDGNSDGIDELVFLYKLDNNYYLAEVPFDKISLIRSLDDFRSVAKIINLDNREWRSIGAGDFGCLI